MAVERKAVKRGVSRMKEVSASFIWEIHQLSRRQRGAILLSDTFSCENDEAIKWRLEYCHSPITSSGAVGSVFQLCLVSSDKFNINCDIEWTMVDEVYVEDRFKEQKVFTQLDSKLSFTPFSIWNYVRNDSIIMCVSLKAFVDLEHYSEPKKGRYDPPPTCLLEDLRRLHDDPSGDLTLHVGGEAMKVHRTIVAARSPVLGAMLQEGKDQLHIPDVELDTMKRVVRYIYTDHVDEIEEMASQLYPVACRFELLGLKAVCEDSLENALTVENAARTLVLANGGFKTRVANFMKRHIAEVIATEAFKSMISTHPQVFLEMFCADVKGEASEESVGDATVKKEPSEESDGDATEKGEVGEESAGDAAVKNEPNEESDGDPAEKGEAFKESDGDATEKGEASDESDGDASEESDGDATEKGEASDFDALKESDGDATEKGDSSDESDGDATETGDASDESDEDAIEKGDASKKSDGDVAGKGEENKGPPTRRVTRATRTLSSRSVLDGDAAGKVEESKRPPARRVTRATLLSLSSTSVPDGDAPEKVEESKELDRDAAGKGDANKKSDGDATGKGEANRKSDGDATGKGDANKKSDGDATGKGEASKKSDGDAAEIQSGADGNSAQFVDFINGSFVVLKSELTAGGNLTLWKIDGKALLQKFIPFEQDGRTLYKNTLTYSGWVQNERNRYAAAPVTFVVQGKKEIILEFNRDQVNMDA